MEPEPASYNDSPPEPSKKFHMFFVVLSLVVFMGFIVYRVVHNQRLNVSNFASSNTVPLDSRMAEQVSVLGVAETSQGSTRYKFRVETPSSFAFSPVSGVLANGSSEWSFEKTTNPYECVDMVVWDRNVLAFETEFVGSATPLTGTIDIIFTDVNNTLFKAVYPIAFNCNILGSDYSQGVQISPEPEDVIPEE